MTRVRICSHRETPSKCRRCLGHGIQTPVKGHASTCPFRLCDCVKCQKVVCRRISSSKNRLKNKGGVVFVKMRCLTGNVRVHAVSKEKLKSLKSSNVVSMVTAKQKQISSPSMASEVSHISSPSTSASTSPQLFPTQESSISTSSFPPTTTSTLPTPFCMPPLAPILSNPLFNLEALIQAYRLNLCLFSPLSSSSCASSSSTFPSSLSSLPSLMPVPIQRLF